MKTKSKLILVFLALIANIASAFAESKFEALRHLFEASVDAIKIEEIPSFSYLYGSGGGYFGKMLLESSSTCLYSHSNAPDKLSGRFLFVRVSQVPNGGPLFPPDRLEKIMTLSSMKDQTKVLPEEGLVQIFWNNTSEPTFTSNEIDFNHLKQTWQIRKSGKNLTWHTSIPSPSGTSIDEYGYCFLKQ